MPAGYSLPSLLSSYFRETPKRRLPRLPRMYSEAQLAGIKQSTMARRLATVGRLRTAIDALKAKKQEISVQIIYDE